jgi:hypothetical protein
MLSKNSASSRAIPVAKLIQSIKDDPFVPLHWGKNQKGMQAFEECNEPVRYRGFDGTDCPSLPEAAWLEARDNVIRIAEAFDAAGYHKQIVNRLIEPWMHITVLASGMDLVAWSNFLALRDHPDAEPHIAMLAREVRKCLDDESTIQTLEPGQWHMPFVQPDDVRLTIDYLRNGVKINPTNERISLALRKLSVARCASTSYKTVDGFDMTLDRAIALHDKLVASTPLHASPCEHVAQADDIGGLGFGRFGWFNPHQHGNFVGFRQYRKMLPNECL